MPPKWKRPEPSYDAVDADLALLILEEKMVKSHEPVIAFAADCIAKIPTPEQRAMAWEGVAVFYETCAQMLHTQAKAEREGA